MTKEQIKGKIRIIQDFPSKGISFKDISPLLADPEAMQYITDEFEKKLTNTDIVVGPDARGFLFGTPLAMQTKKPFVMVRKPGKLPGDTIIEEYALEYGTNTLQMQVGSIKPGQKVTIVDDLLATGGTTKAIINLVEKQGGIIDQILFVIELTFLPGREGLEKYNISSLVEF